MITAEQVNSLSKLKGISLLEAKHILDKIDLVQQINEAKSDNEIKLILLKMVDML